MITISKFKYITEFFEKYLNNNQSKKITVFQNYKIFQVIKRDIIS